MKKVLLLALAFAGVAFTSCTKTTDPATDENGRAAINLGADILTAGAQNAATKIDGNKFPVNQTNAFAVTAYKGTIPTSYAGSQFDNAAVNSDASGKLAFATSEYFPNDGAKLYFYAFAPAGGQVTYTAGTSTTPPKAAYTITGKEDIMWAKEESGLSKDNAATPVKFVFQHMLKKVAFTVKGTKAYADLGKKLQTLKITNAKNKLSVDAITGLVTFDSESLVTLTAYNATLIDITEAASAKFGAIMVEPGSTFNIEVGTTNTNEHVRAIVDLSTLTGQGSAGYSYTVNLKLDVSGNKILVDAEITDWIDGGSTPDIPIM